MVLNDKMNLKNIIKVKMAFSTLYERTGRLYGGAGRKKQSVRCHAFSSQVASNKN